MARISNFSKEFTGSDGSSPKNNLIIELLEKHGAAGKTASSTFPGELEAAVVADLKALGFVRTGNADASPAPEEKKEAKSVVEEKKENTEKKEAPVKEEAPKAAAPEKKEERPAANANARPEGHAPAQHGQQPPQKKKKSIIIVGGNAQQQRPAQGGPANRGGYGNNQGGGFNRGPIRPRENMIDRAGAISNKRMEEERARQIQEQKRIEAENERRLAEERANEAARAAEQSANAEAERPAPAANNRPADNRQFQGQRPAPSGDRFQGRNDRPAPSGDRPYRSDRPAPSGDRFQGRNDRNGAPGGRPFNNQGGQGGGRPFNNQGGRPAPGGRGGFNAPAPAPETKNDNRRGRHSDKDRDREQKKNSSIYEDNLGKGRNNRAGSFQKPVAKKQEVQEDDIKVITLPDSITVKELAEKMRIQPSEIVKKLFMQGEMVTVNQEISFEKAEEIAIDYEIMCEREEKVDVIAELLKEDDEEESKLVARPPVICVMGHVDHGKTSLLDAIRKTHVTDKEAGGITQHIGAYTVSIDGRSITFLDTPGHEAFTSMRMRGANSTDIAILVVAADDGVMPQTVEAINHAKAAGIEIIVAVNKIDKPGANVDRVKQELTEYELVSEDWGGSTIFAPVSAKTGEGIDNLLEMILLTADVLELKANPRRRARGLVIEAELDKGRGPVATVLVQKGTLHVGDFISAGASHGKVRAMVDDKGRRVKDAGPSTPVEILGLNDVPNAGEIFICHPNDKEAKNFADTFIAQNKEKLLEDTKAKMSLEDVFSKIQEGNLKELNLIIKADVQGSVEAVKQSLLKLSNEEVVVKAIHGGVGAINESDVVLASASNAIIIGFNVRPDAVAKQTAEREGVDVRLYKVIYQAIEDIEAAMKGMLDPVFEEKIIGHAEVRQIFKASAVGNIAGAFVLDGTFQRDCKIRISREGEQIYEGALSSLKRFKDDVKEVK
ncbi:MAG: translation initiation factor IF-2, partial [Lachnospiraceae bacterium]|nr:translation initiation factor IF-2 [Lachnospiraceae bacterium]